MLPDPAFRTLLRRYLPAARLQEIAVGELQLKFEAAMRRYLLSSPSQLSGSLRFRFDGPLPLEGRNRRQRQRRGRALAWYRRSLERGLRGELRSGGGGSLDEFLEVVWEALRVPFNHSWGDHLLLPRSHRQRGKGCPLWQDGEEAWGPSRSSRLHQLPEGDRFRDRARSWFRQWGHRLDAISIERFAMTEWELDLSLEASYRCPTRKGEGFPPPPR